MSETKTEKTEKPMEIQQILAGLDIISKRLDKLENRDSQIFERKSNDATTKDVATKVAEEALVPTIIKMVNEIKAQLPEQVKAIVLEEVHGLSKGIHDEAEQALRNGIFGKQGPSIPLAELESYVEKIIRKSTLETASSGKKTITETTDKPSEGGDVTKTVKIDVNAAFQKMQKDRGVV